MPRIRLIMLAALAVFALSALASASSASAECRQVAVPGTGTFENNICTVAGGTKEFIKISKLETRLKGGEWCAKVETAGTGTFSDNKCTNTVGAKEFIKVKVHEWTVPCHKVIAANKGLGDFNNNTCTEPGGTKEFSDVLLAGERAELSEFLPGAVIASRIKLDGITVEAAKVSLGAEPTNDFITGTNGGSIKAAGLKFEEAKVSSPAGCKITAETITTKEEIELVLSSTSAALTFKPVPSTGVFAEFGFANEAGCGVLKGKTVQVTGKTKGTISNPATCEENHRLSINEKPSELKAAGAAVEEFFQEITLPAVENLNGVDAGDECWDA
jgi:hypothetical protein